MGNVCRSGCVGSRADACLVAEESALYSVHKARGAKAAEDCLEIKGVREYLSEYAAKVCVVYYRYGYGNENIRNSDYGKKHRGYLDNSLSAAEKAEAERLAAEKAEAERLAREKAEEESKKKKRGGLFGFFNRHS